MLFEDCQCLAFKMPCTACRSMWDVSTCQEVLVHRGDTGSFKSDYLGMRIQQVGILTPKDFDPIEPLSPLQL